MKIREGFVSNSSSSSFCIYGVHLHDLNMDYETTEKVDELVGLFCYSSEYGDGVFLGHSFSAMHNDETLKQFKDRTLNDIKRAFEMFPEDFKITNMEVGGVLNSADIYNEVISC